jgi:hypothetical protein
MNPNGMLLDVECIAIEILTKLSSINNPYCKLAHPPYNTVCYDCCQQLNCDHASLYCNKRDHIDGFCNTMAATGRAGTAYAFGSPQLFPVFRRVSDAQSLVFCTALCQLLFVCLSFVDLCFVNRCLSFYPFSFGHCVVYPSSIDGF